MKTIIFDVDGTLTDPGHRRHLVDGSGKKNWPKFTDEMVNDTPHAGVCLLAQLVATHHAVVREKIAIFVFSGRPDSHRQQTEDQLNEFVPDLLRVAEGLHMRAANDSRSDVIVKREMLNAIREAGYDPVIAVDDRPSVCEMWREEGLTVLKHDTGEWE